MGCKRGLREALYPKVSGSQVCLSNQFNKCTLNGDIQYMCLFLKAMVQGSVVSGSHHFYHVSVQCFCGLSFSCYHQPCTLFYKQEAPGKCDRDRLNIIIIKHII